MRIGLYADGTYFCKCVACSETFLGDKRAIHCLRCAAKLLEAQLATAKAQNQSFGNVLAIIHRDGGHYITKHGHEKASKDAIKIVLDLRKDSDHE